MLEQPIIFGLDAFVKDNDYEVSKQNIDDFTLLLLEPKPDSPHLDAYGNGINVVMKDGKIVGAKVSDNHVEEDPEYPRFEAVIVGRELIGCYMFQKDAFSVYQGNFRQILYFEDLITAFDSEDCLQVGYYLDGDKVKAKSFKFGGQDDGEIWLSEINFPFRNEKYTLERIADDGLIVASIHNYHGKTREVKFPQEVNESNYRELERMLATNTEWHDLQTQMPIFR